MKKIKINPAFFNMSKKRKGTKEKKKKPHNTSLKINNIKTALMNRIKKHQKMRLQNEGSIINPQPVNDFKSTIEYLEKVSKEKKPKEKKEPNKSSLLKSKDRPPPPYSLLKGGSKPLFSQYNKTLKNKIQFENKEASILKIKHEEPKKDSIKNENDRKQKLAEIKKKFQDGRKKKRRLIRRTLGKRDRKVGILVNCKKTRKKIGKLCQSLHKKPIHEMKRKLRKKGLIKVGSQAPDDIVKSIFTNSQLAGDIENKNGGVLVYNYMKDGL